MRKGRDGQKKSPEIAVDLDVVLVALGDLGYDGLDGRQTREMVEAMERITYSIERGAGVGLK